MQLYRQLQRPAKIGYTTVQNNFLERVANVPLKGGLEFPSNSTLPLKAFLVLRLWVKSYMWYLQIKMLWSDGHSIFILMNANYRIHKFHRKK